MYTFIIIDDEKIIREGLIKKLSNLSDTVQCIGQADNGKEGIALIGALQPDIVILDMQMPIMDGTQLLPMLAERYPDMPLIVISGYRDFDYIKHAISARAIDYIVKPFSRETVQKSMLDAISRIESRSSYEKLLSDSVQNEISMREYDMQMLLNLILGYNTANNQIHSKKFNFINDTHNLLLLTLHFDTPGAHIDIQDFIRENNFEDMALYLHHPDYAHHGFIIIFVPQNRSLNDKQLAMQVAESLIPWLAGVNCKAIIGISNSHHSITSLHKAFTETSEALNCRLLTNHDTNFYFVDNNYSQLFISWDKKDEFLFRIESGMTEEVTLLTDELFEYYCTISNCRLSDVKYHLYQLGDECRIIMNAYINQVHKNSSSVQSVVSYIFSLEELKRYYLQFFTNISNMLKPQSIYLEADVIKRMEIYISKNYYKNITQDFLAYLFNLNRSYLSQLFKMKTGQKFVDYLNSVRIEKAKELLQKSDRKIYQVSKAVGYDNVKYFFKVFKKTTGKTPEQWRIEE